MLNEQNGEPIDMNSMPRPRRRREKKLMSMDEVNERFPLTKYKIWRSGREKSGLPAAGGITAPPSRAASIREHSELKRVSTEAPATEDGDSASRPSHENTVNRPLSSIDGTDEQTSHTPDRNTISHEKSPRLHFEKRVSRETNVAKGPPPTVTPAAVSDDADDPIEEAGIPAEYANKPGDSCAICIDTLEDDDDVRGLTCGHAFHAGCLDPWLTSRRACCPLCKADFYIPKPRNNEQATAGADLPQPPEQAARRGRVSVGGADYEVRFHHRLGFPTLIRGYRPARAARQAQSGLDQNANTNQARETEQPTVSRFGHLRSHLPSPRVPFRRTQTLDVSGGPDQATPGQLEAGTR